MVPSVRYTAPSPSGGAAVRSRTETAPGGSGKAGSRSDGGNGDSTSAPCSHAGDGSAGSPCSARSDGSAGSPCSARSASSGSAGSPCSARSAASGSRHQLAAHERARGVDEHRRARQAEPLRRHRAAEVELLAHEHVRPPGLADGENSDGALPRRRPGEHLAQHPVLALVAWRAQRHRRGRDALRPARREGRVPAPLDLAGHRARRGERDLVPGRPERGRDRNQRLEVAATAGEREQDPHRKPQCEAQGTPRAAEHRGECD